MEISDGRPFIQRHSLQFNLLNAPKGDSMLDYGVLHGSVDRAKREDNDSTPHYQILVIDQAGTRWRVPVNVQSVDGSELQFWLVDPLQGHSVLNGLTTVKSGFTPLVKGQRDATNALDFVRSPLFDRSAARKLPASGAGTSDDLQDLLELYIKQLIAAKGEIYAFGARFSSATTQKPIDREFKTKTGMHDIHMNQGNPPGKFAADNGTFQDGGLILKFSDRYVGLFLKFQTQSFDTDENGNVRTKSGSMPPADQFDIYIERALINPAGEDMGKEVVVLGNLTTKTVDLKGWSLVDRNQKAETIADLVLPPGESGGVKLSGKALQLGNKGGNLQLKDPTGKVVHAVSYSQEQAVNDRFVQF
jgi:uncharacterized protein YukJ